MEDLLKANNKTRIRSRDAFMLMALWYLFKLFISRMEHYPSAATKTVSSVRKTGCLLVDPRDRILSLQHTGESHAIVRAILQSTADPHGCDV